MDILVRMSLLFNLGGRVMNFLKNVFKRSIESKECYLHKALEGQGDITDDEYNKLLDHIIYQFKNYGVSKTVGWSTKAERKTKYQKRLDEAGIDITLV